MSYIKVILSLFYPDFCGPRIREHKTQEICRDQKAVLSLECPTGEIIYVNSVFYGESSSLCDWNDVTECNSTQVLQLITQYCEFQSTCSIPFNEDLESGNLCGDALEGRYLKVNYTCYGQCKYTYHWNKSL